MNAQPRLETVGEAIARGATVLAAAGVADPVRESRLLLAHAAALPLSALLDRGRPVETARFDDVLKRRASREPFAFITGRQGFWTLDLEVSPDTLIPRADSETLIQALQSLRDAGWTARTILDLGTGTGALLLAALTLFPDAWGVGVDRSAPAAGLARRNAMSNGLEARASFLVGDWLAAVAGRFDAILCNPPYIDDADIAALMPEVARFEPLSALAGGPDGLDAYRVLVPRTRSILTEGGVAVFEVGEGQAPAVASLGTAAGLVCDVRHDLGGHARAVVFRPG